MKQKRHEYKFRLEAIVLAQVNRAKNSRTRLAPVSALLIVLGKLDNVAVKCARFKGTTMNEFIDKKEFTGNLFEILENVISFLKNHLNLSAKIDDLKRKEEYEIPLVAIREALLNALVHRDYTRNRDIKVAVYDDILEITSPGALPNGITIEDISNGRSELRNKVLANLVAFTDKSNLKTTIDDNREKALDEFKENQSNAILKSESVEKNDGKAKYILRRLFKAYITNSHQLPDLGLRYILISLIRDGELTEVVKSEKKACKEILDKLKKTMIDNTQTNDELKKIWETDLLEFKTHETAFEEIEKGKSNEIKAALEKRKKLADFFQKLDKKQGEIIRKVNSEKEKDKEFIKDQLRNLRAILDNSILNKTLYWEGILIRGICDYIAALTDQEAVNEYEKLYAGIMELV